ncbi:MAG: cyclase [Proteobacteria bacterium]|nr:MAG: cyclase [Pseudomonadota bacterium]
MKFEVSKSPYGENDEIGRLNEITAESRRAVLSRVDASRVYDLSVDYFMGMPSWDFVGDPPYQIWMTHTPSGTVIDNPMNVDEAVNRYVSYSGDAISMYTHCGTHIDTLNHFGYNGLIWNHFKESEHLGTRHWKVCGADKFPPIIARGVMLDIAGLKGVDVLAPSYGIGADDIRAACKRQNVALQKGDVVLLRTGRMRLWPDHDKYLIDEPGLNLEGAMYLAEEGGCIAIGGDNVALEQLPSADPDSYLPVHCYLFAVVGVVIMEVIMLEELARDRISEFGFFGAPLRLRGATGSPMRTFAIPFGT